jgi:predicted metalloprotease with PDZ domain
MGRDKRLTEQQTWQRIYNGFQKGIRGSKGETLKTTAQNMREFRAFRNVYWSGAAMLLKADVALRKESNGKESLDTVLKKIQQNTLPKSRSWTGLEMMQTMDTLANTNVFMDTYNLHIHSKIFPVGDEYWAQLGIIIKEDVVYLDDKAPLAHIRKNLLKNGK